MTTSEFVSVEDDKGRAMLVVWTVDGNPMRLGQFMRPVAEAMAHDIAAALATWPGFESLHW